MNYDVVRKSVSDAYRAYKCDDKLFCSKMNDFYTEGKKNPSVAKLIMQACIKKGLVDSNNMLTDISALSTPDLLEPSISTSRINLYNLSVNSVLKSVEATDLYKNTEHLDGDYASICIESKKDFDKSWKDKYPRSGKLRERIIESNRISMDKVNKKAGWFEKINYAKTLGEYRKDYPKTFFARYYLILNNKIEEGQVNPKIKNWFERFIYKRFIKDRFSFKK